MTELEMSPDVLTADAVGTPGKRVFYIQTRGDFGTRTFLVEKAQVAILADRLRELLVMIDQEDTIRTATPGRDPALALDAPGAPEWRIGTMGLAYDEDDDRVMLFLQPVGPEDEVTEDEPEDDDEAGVRFLLRRDQVRSFVLHALAVVAEGRPLCQLCGLPMDPDGHLCPASNGHHPGT